MNSLRKRRKALGLSIPEIHRRTGIPLRTLEDWDVEKRVPNSYYRIRVLSKLLECSEEEFMTKEEECMYNSKPADVALIQEDKDVRIYIIADDDVNIKYEGTISRAMALELLDYLKKSQEITLFFKKQNIDV